MATNHAQVGDGLKIVQQALAPYIARELTAVYKGDWWGRVYYNVPEQTRLKLPKSNGTEADLAEEVDVAGLLYLFCGLWRDVFARTLPKAALTHANELRDQRNRWAHAAGADLTPEEAYRALSTMSLFLETIDKPSSKRLRPLEQAAKRAMLAADKTADGDATDTARPPQPAKTHSTPVKPTSAPAQASLGLGMRPWREVIQPHRDVATGNYETAEFAADLADVLAGKAEPDYQDPAQFFARTFVTAGMRHLLASALRRVAGNGGDPVIQLKTAFGGGKTHTMLALYHLICCGPAAGKLPGLEPVFAEADVQPAKLPKVAVAVLVGTDLESTKPRLDAAGHGVTVRTLWGEMAAQLGGPGAYEIVRSADEAGVAPGAATLLDLFAKFGPGVVLVDEFVAYARNLIGKSDLPAGTFDANLTFIQALTEATRRSRHSLVIASIPESNKEIGGEAGKEAQARLEQIFGRLEAVWKPVAAEEGFEIVRRRLFGELSEPGARDVTCLQFHRLYNGSSADFPHSAGEIAYLDRLKSAYPIHPEVFQRLYDDWATLEEFQRTRGVLRLMAAVVHALWVSGDQSPLILPGSLPLDHTGVRNELLRYLPDTWNSVVDRDVDGDRAMPREIDASQPRFGQIAAGRRLARAIFLGSAPDVVQQKTRGIEAPQIRLGVVQPNEGIPVYIDALHQLADKLTYLYSGDGHYWYDTRPNLNRTADERAAAVEEYKVTEEIRRRLAADHGRGDFKAVHLFAESGDVPDVAEARLVVLRPEAAHRQRQPDSPALRMASAILETRGNAPRLHKNMLIFVAADEEGAKALQQVTRRYLAWTSIAADADTLNLDAFGRRQAKEQREKDDRTVTARLHEAYCWLLVPQQPSGTEWSWDIARINGATPVVQRATAKLRQGEQLITKWSAPGLKLELDRWFWKDADAVETRRLWDALANYGYLPRLADEQVLLDAIAGGLAAPDYFAYARSRNSDGRYEGLIFNTPTLATQLTIDSYSLLVKREVARRQIEADEAKERARLEQELARQQATTGTATTSPEGDGRPAAGHVIQDAPGPIGGTIVAPPPPAASQLRRYFGAVTVDAKRINRDAAQVADEIVQHLTGLPHAEVSVTIEIEADIPEGIPDDVVRTVLENARVLKFTTSTFEEGD